MIKLSTNHPLALTETECEILEAIKRHGKLSHVELSRVTPHGEYKYGPRIESKVRAHVSNINKKIRHTGYALFSIRNYGYCYDKIQKTEEADRHAI